jgi:6-phosphofructokinase 1
MEKKDIRSIAVLTSGGDSPGMNAAIRAVVRTALGKRLKVYGIQRGYSGLLKNDIIELNASSVGNIIQRGGTILQTSRSPEFMEYSAREQAVQILHDRSIDALVVIGGNGSYNGAHALATEFQFPVIGMPGTIDNDISGTDYTIGFDTAVQTALEAVDKIRDTALSNDRTFLVEVMGRKSSAIALKVGVCCGAENVILNDQKVNYEQIAADIRRGMRRGKGSSILIVAEGDKAGKSYEISKVLEDMHSISSRVCVLGHIQRGGSPTSNDRFIASIMGKQAVQSLIDGKTDHAVCMDRNQVVVRPLSECIVKKDDILTEYKGLTESLSI